MEHLLNQWELVKSRLEGESIFLFLDYDGTLAPIAKKPEQAVISGRAKKILTELSRLSYAKLAIISGRSLKDIKKMIGLKTIIYAGNHGLELEGPKIRFKSQVSSKVKSRMRYIYKELRHKLSKINGILLEDKGLTLSLHYRLINEKDLSFVKTVFQEAVIVDKVKGIIATKAGKKVLEIRPAVEWDKGKAVLWLLARQRLTLKGSKIFPIYIGDDATDEDAFKALKTRGLTIFVGEPKTSLAQYYLKDPEEVLKFMEQILELRKGEKLCLN